MIHNSSVIDKKAKVSNSVKIGPFCYVGPDVELSDEGAKVVVLEVEREHVLARRRGIRSVCAAGGCQRPPRPEAMRARLRKLGAIDNLERLTVLAPAHQIVRRGRRDDLEELYQEGRDLQRRTGGGRTHVWLRVTRCRARRREEKGRVGVQRVVAASQGARGQRLVKLEVVHHFSRGRVAA